MVLFSLPMASVILPACSGDDEPIDATIDIGPAPVSISSLAPGETTAPPANPEVGPATEAPAGTTTTVDSGIVFPEGPDYEVVGRTPGESGDILIVLVERGSSGSLSDIDLQEVIADVYDRFPPVLEAHVVDDPGAADLALAEGVEAVAISMLRDHYVARLEDGFRIVFLGPYEEYGTATLGS